MSAALTAVYLGDWSNFKNLVSAAILQKRKKNTSNLKSEEPWILKFTLDYDLKYLGEPNQWNWRYGQRLDLGPWTFDLWPKTVDHDDIKWWRRKWWWWHLRTFWLRSSSLSSLGSSSVQVSFLVHLGRDCQCDLQLQPDLTVQSAPCNTITTAISQKQNPEQRPLFTSSPDPASLARSPRSQSPALRVFSLDSR